MPLRLTTYNAGSTLPTMPGTDTFHSTGLFRVYQGTPGYEPLLILATEDGRPLAKLLAVICRKPGSLWPKSFRRCVAIGVGEYFDQSIDRESVFAEMLQRLTQEAMRNAFFVEFRNLEQANFGYKAFRDNQYFAVNWLKVRNSLHATDKVEDRLSPSRLRQIKKAADNGATLSEATQKHDVHTLATLLARNYKAKPTRRFPGIRLIENLVEGMPPETLGIHLVKHQSKVIGGSICIYSKGNAYLWLSGAMKKTYAPQYPGVMAVWTAMQQAIGRGCKHLEFMDVGMPFRRHGYRHFVLRFGGKQSSTRRWFRFRWKWLNNLLNRIYA